MWPSRTWASSWNRVLCGRGFDRVDGDQAFPGEAEAVTIDVIEQDLLDLKRRECLTGVPVWDLRCRHRIAVGLAQDEPGHDVAGIVSGGFSDDLGLLALHGDRHTERDRLLALLDLPAEGTPAGIGGHRAGLQAALGTEQTPSGIDVTSVTSWSEANGW